MVKTEFIFKWLKHYVGLKTLIQFALAGSGDNKKL
jgi:hypothetical protein